MLIVARGIMACPLREVKEQGVGGRRYTAFLKFRWIPEKNHCLKRLGLGAGGRRFELRLQPHCHLTAGLRTIQAIRPTQMSFKNCSRFINIVCWLLLVFPHLFLESCTSGHDLVHLVLDRVFLVIVLVVFLGRVERRVRKNLCHNRIIKLF